MLRCCRVVGYITFQSSGCVFQYVTSLLGCGAGPRAGASDHDNLLRQTRVGNNIDIFGEFDTAWFVFQSHNYFQMVFKSTTYRYRK